MSKYKLSKYTRSQVAAIDEKLAKDFDDVKTLSENFTQQDPEALKLDSLVALKLEPQFKPDWPKRTTRTTPKKRTPAKKATKTKPEKKPVKQVVKAKPKAKSAATRSRRKPQPALEQNKFSLEIQLMRYLVEQEGEEKSLESMKRFWIKAKRASKLGQLEHKTLFRYVLSKLREGIKKAEELKHSKMQYSLNTETREKLETAIKKAKPVMRITYLAGLHGGK